MDEQLITRKIDEILAAWTDITGNGGDEKTRRELARRAAQIMLAQEWGPGDVIADAVESVTDGSTVFRRVLDDDGGRTGAWTATLVLGEPEMLTSFGPVWAVETPVDPVPFDSPEDAGLVPEQPGPVSAAVAALGRAEEVFRKVMIPKSGVRDAKLCEYTANKCALARLRLALSDQFPS